MLGVASPVECHAHNEYVRQSDGWLQQIMALYVRSGNGGIVEAKKSAALVKALHFSAIACL